MEQEDIYNMPKFKKPRKRIIAILGAIAIAAVVTVVIVTSSGGASLYQRALDNLSEARFFMRAAHNDNTRVQFFSGIREEPYAVDGRASGTVPFALLNVEPQGNNHMQATQLQGTLIIGEESLEVTLVRNQFGRNFAVDIGRAVTPETAVTFTLNQPSGVNEEFTLTHAMPEDAIDWQEALRIGASHLSDKISGAQFESYVKIITDLANIGAFWFVQFITTDNQTHFVVINPDGSLIGS